MRRRRQNPGDETIRSLHRRVAQGDLGAVRPLLVALERSGLEQPFMVFLASVDGGQDPVTFACATREGALAVVGEWIKSNLKDGWYANGEDAAAIGAYLAASDFEGARALHNDIAANDGMRRDEHVEWYIVTPQELKP